MLVALSLIQGWSSMVAQVGHHLENYQLIRLLGGAILPRSIWAHFHLGIQAAIKVLNAQLAQAAIGAFRAEAHTIAVLGHPHIVLCSTSGSSRARLSW